MYNRVLTFLENLPLIRNIIQVLHEKKVGKSDATYHSVITHFIDGVKRNHIQERSNNVAFNFIMAIFPTIIFLFTLIPYIPVKDLDVQLMEIIKPPVLPESLYEVVAETIYDIISVPRGGLLSLGFFLALFLSTNGMLSLMSAFNRSYRSVDRRGFIRSRLIATVLTVLLTLIIFTAITLLIVAEQVLNFMVSKGWVFIEDYIIYLFFILRFLVIFFIFQIAISSIYYIAPSVKKRWKFFSIGSILAALACVGTSFVFSYYINNFGAYNKLYGSIGALIAIMVWVSTLSLILLLGFELNVSIEKATGLSSAVKTLKKKTFQTKN